MGIFQSRILDEKSIPFYNEIRYENIIIKVIETLDSTRFIGIIKEGWKTKKLLCRAYGYKLNNNADKNLTLSVFNSLINEGNGIFRAEIHGVDSYGYVLVTLNLLGSNKSVNEKMLLTEDVIPETHQYYHELVYK